jgi:hypothetical protein
MLYDLDHWEGQGDEGATHQQLHTKVIIQQACTSSSHTHDTASVLAQSSVRKRLLKNQNSRPW